MTEQLQTTIFFVRHGQTDFAYVGDKATDSKRVLTEFGKEQSLQNGSYLRAFAPAAIYSSPLKRTLETAEIIKKAAEIPGKIIEENDLFEIYDNASWQSIAKRLPEFFDRIIKKHPGKQVVCVSHQDVIEGALRALGVTAEEAQFPCQMGEIYRLIFAGDRFVQAIKLTPARQ